MNKPAVAGSNHATIMKRILLALASLALFLPSAPRAEADVSIDFFYTNLSGGSWIEVGDYGYCWQPEIAVSNRDWRPYADGYWAYTDVGWTWVSYEDFGWATYHYGRWSRLRDHGWVWVPGYEWGPAWVSWRTGGDYVGWAPLPPRRYGYGGDEYVYSGRAIGTSVDIEFDIGPAYYNFVDVRYIGAPVLREHIYAPTQNITYINQTVNVTNITYNNSTVYNYGPDYNRLSAYSTRPIQRLTLQRDTSVDLNAAVQQGGVTKVQGDRLVVAAPPVVQKPAEPVAPKVVKTKVETPNVETGWMGVTDAKAKAQLQDKMKKEDPKKVPPPQIAPKNPDALNAAAPGASPGTETATAPGAGDAAAAGTNAANMDRGGRGKGKDKNQRGDAAAPTSQPQTADGSAPPQGNDTDVAPGAQNDQRGRGNRNKDRRGRDEVQPPAADTAPAVTTPDAGSVPPAAHDQSRGRGKRDRQTQSPNVPADAPVQPPAGAAPESAPPQPAPGLENERRERPNKERGRRDDAGAAQSGGRPPEVSPATSQQDAESSAPSAERPRNIDDARGRGRGKEKRERIEMPQQQAPAPEMAPPPQAPAREMMRERARERRERQEGPRDIAPPPQAPAREMMQEERGRGRRERQAMPPQIAPQPQGGPASGAPAPPPEGRGKPERKKKKDGDGGQQP